jgi:hypothetical protein
MDITVRIEPKADAQPAVDYRWDTDTDILTATVKAKGVSEGMSGLVGLEGSDGSWLNLDIAAGLVNGVEVVVWPNVRKHSSLVPPNEIEDAKVIVPARASQPGIASLEVDTPLSADADLTEKTIHFRVGPPRQVRTVRIARDILLDIDTRSRIAGLWLLNVPPFPGERGANDFGL